MTLLLVDTANVYMRNRSKLSHLTTKDGEVSGDLYGYIRSVNAAQNKWNVDHSDVVHCFEAGGAVKRQEILPEYKADRMQEDLFLPGKLEALAEHINLSGQVMYAAKEREADDCIAHLVRQNQDVYILSQDHDFNALLSMNCALVHKLDDVRTEDTFAETYRFPPRYYLMYLALVGDGSDNVPPVGHGMNKQRATTLIEQHMNGDSFWDEPEFAEMLDQYRINISIVSFMPIEPGNVMELRGHRDPDALLAYYEGWEFKSLVKKLNGEAP